MKKNNKIEQPKSLTWAAKPSTIQIQSLQNTLPAKAIERDRRCRQS